MPCRKLFPDAPANAGGVPDQLLVRHHVRHISRNASSTLRTCPISSMSGEASIALRRLWRGTRLFCSPPPPDTARGASLPGRGVTHARYPAATLLLTPPPCP